MFFGKKAIRPLEVDIHSHLIPNIDDGSKSLENSVELIKGLQESGFKKVITTPHIHPSYPNSEKKIRENLIQVQAAIHENGLDIKLDTAAEYFVDEKFIEKVKKNEELLSFGDNYILIESSFISKPYFFESVVFMLKSAGYKPILAHPERYMFLEGKISWLEELKNAGVLFQVTLGSLSGYYGKQPKKIGFQLIRSGYVDFLATDLHKISQIDFVKKGLEQREVQNLIRRDKLLNSKLL